MFNQETLVLTLVITEQRSLALVLLMLVVLISQIVHLKFNLGNAIQVMKNQEILVKKATLAKDIIVVAVNGNIAKEQLVLRTLQCAAYIVLMICTLTHAATVVNVMVDIKMDIAQQIAVLVEVLVETQEEQHLLPVLQVMLAEIVVA